MTNEGEAGTVTPLNKKPARLLPEMQIRWLMSYMDKVDQLALVVKFTDGNPVVSISSNCSQYFLALASAILDREALKGLPEPGGQK